MRSERATAPGHSVPLSVPEIRGNEWTYIKDCLDTNFVSSVGPYVDRFEAEVARYLGAPYAVATINGTAALHVALHIAGVRQDDEVLVSALTFIAPTNAIRYVGAWPVFVDAEPTCWQMDPRCVVEFVERECRWTDGQLRNRETGRTVRAILPVHILGHPVDMDPILEVARRFNLVVIEDATEGLGARYRGRAVGTLGDVACLSFNGNKLMTTGGGGMLVTGNEDWARRAKYLTTQAKDDPVEFIHNEIGYNYRLSNLQAAMGVAQLEQLDAFIGAKRRIAAKYAEALSGVRGISSMPEAAWADSVYWLYTVLVDESRYGLTSRQLMAELASSGIQTRPLWQPGHRSPAHMVATRRECPVADRLHQTALSLPCSVGLTEEDQARVLEVVTSTVHT